MATPALQETRPQKAQRWLRSMRNGLSPVSIVRHRLANDQTLRFRGVTVSTDDPPSAWDLAFPIWSGEYDEPGFVPRRGWNVVDIGANIGFFSMLAGSRGARVTAYEPHPESFRHLQRNTGKWAVDCRQAAVVGDGSESVRLYVHPERSSRNTLTGAEIGSGEALTSAIDVPAIDFSDVLREPVDLLKVDCEGAEFGFLDQADVVRNAKRIIAEVHTTAGDPEELRRAVEAAGFDARLERSAADPLQHRDEAFLMLTAVRR
jgi:FkbM family methyltransferase